MAKVTFQQDQVLVNGVVVGELSGRGEVYIRLLNSKNEMVTVARFKYRSPKAGAKHWLKFVLDRWTTATLVELLVEKRAFTPLGLAEHQGYKSLNQLHCEKVKAKQELLRNTPVRIVTWAELGVAI